MQIKRKRNPIGSFTSYPLPNYPRYVFRSNVILLLTQFPACALMSFLGDCTCKLAPQLNGMEVEYGATSHIKEGRKAARVTHDLQAWIILCTVHN